MHGFTFGDSLDENKRNKWLDFKTRLTKVHDHGFMCTSCMKLVHLERSFLIVSNNLKNASSSCPSDGT